jgi:hypothetical protein
MDIPRYVRLWGPHLTDYLGGSARLAAAAAVAAGRRAISWGSSLYRGVSRNGTNWRAHITIGGKTIYLGSFLLEEDAARTYDKAITEKNGR